MKILIVEDETRARQGLYDQIQSFGPPFEVIGEAEDGLEGLRMVKELRPDVVLTDIRMPKLDGLQMVEDVRNCKLDVIFVILSGYAEFEYAQKGITLGVEDYLLKPITVKKLRETMERIHQKFMARSGEEPMEERQFSKAVQSIVNDVKKNCSQKLSINDYAEKFKMSPEYISRIFAKETGDNFSSYLTKVRIHQAKQLLLNTDYKIYEIAIMVGYNDSQYFCRVFKKEEGISAKEYILKHGLKNKGV